jgi:hypothetical protein
MDVLGFRLYWDDKDECYVWGADRIHGIVGLADALESAYTMGNQEGWAKGYGDACDDAREA